jgi:UTP--glucose-1-phosphate uridylyltransferase
MIKKAVILTAGLGTRFLPITKVVPKALLPIGPKPIVQYLVEEAAASGIEEVIFVISPDQTAIQDYFTGNEKLEKELEQRGKTEELAKLKEVESLAKFSFVVQQEAQGDGHAILQAKDLIGDENFAVLFGDDIIKAETPALKQLINVYEKTNTPVLATEEIPPEKSSSYGIIDPINSSQTPIQIKGLVEKPKPEDAPSNLGIIGKYICTNEVLKDIENASASHPDQELRLIDGFINMLQNGKTLHALKIEGQRFDTGSPEGLLKAKIAFS